MTPTPARQPVSLLPCPFCGRGLGDDLIDVLYPTGGWRWAKPGCRSYVSPIAGNLDGRVWTVHCTKHSGGCGAEISGDSKPEAIAAWNSRPVAEKAEGERVLADPRNFRPVAWEHQCSGGSNVLSYIENDERIENVKRVRPLLYADTLALLPTVAMVEAGCKEVWPGWPDGTGKSLGINHIYDLDCQRMRSAYTAMLAAAPAPAPAEQAMVCGGCGAPWTGETCGQRVNGTPGACTPIPAPAPTGEAVAWNVPKLPGNWPEDATHENGDYECRCCHCGATFYGHKRRVTCKVCASPQPSQSVEVSEGMVRAFCAAYNCEAESDFSPLITTNQREHVRAAITAALAAKEK